MKHCLAVLLFALGALLPVAGGGLPLFAQSADAELNVTYHYTTPSAVTTVPEPGTHALFWVGLVVVGWVNRLQRRRLS